MPTVSPGAAQPDPLDEVFEQARAMQQLLEQALSLPASERAAFLQPLVEQATLAEMLDVCARVDAGTLAAPAAGESLVERVRSTATDSLLEHLEGAPKLDLTRYRLGDEIARGGMGMVVRIHDTQLNRRLAMKRMLEREPALTEADRLFARQVLGRFLEEAQITSQLDHPGVVPVHELGLDPEGRVYFTMRLVKGRTASEVFADAHAERNEWTTTRALEVVLKVCDTVAYAHQKGVLHRDLKPQNVMVGRFGEVYVMDWGLAKVLDQEDRHDLRPRLDASGSISQLRTARRDDAAHAASSVVSMDGQRLGTPSYMAPEQARGEPVDRRADVYSIGAMLYELLTGGAPYETPGQSRDAYRILADVVEGPPRRVEDLAKAVPPALAAIVEKAMHRERSQRYQRVLELAADLRAFLDQRVVSAHRTGAIVEFRLWVRRNRSLAAALAAAAAILVAGVVTSSAFAARFNTLATENAGLAARESAAKDLAIKEKERADATVHDFTQLKSVLRMENALKAVDGLYPALPDKTAALEQWVQTITDLQAARPEVEQTLAGLRRQALPATADELEENRRTHPRAAELRQLQRNLAALRRAQAVRAGGAPPTAELTAEQQALDAEQLNDFAWRLVDPERAAFGDEAVALAAARLAVRSGEQHANAHEYLDTLAWALFANGLDAEACAASDQALARAPTEHADAFRSARARLAEAIRDAAVTIERVDAEVQQLSAIVGAQRTFRFADESRQFLHDALVTLCNTLDGIGTVERQVRSGLTWSKVIRRLSLDHPNARHAWPDVREAIAANPRYSGRAIDLRDEDVLGLVPIGENPVTHLWEFYDLRSAWDGVGDAARIPIPKHDADGGIVIDGDTGIVLVLLPGGSFTMGAQHTDPGGPQFDEQAQDDEQPHAEFVGPFFLARHELTQGQWRRLASWSAMPEEPSLHKTRTKLEGIGLIDDTHPVEAVSWRQCDRLLRHGGLRLPSEAQWEYACRAGTTTPWAVPKDRLHAYANLADDFARRAGAPWKFEAWDDGHAIHAPVGSYLANAFGLHEMHGNVWEWTSDPHPSDAKSRVYRGGSYNYLAVLARSSNRGRLDADTTNGDAGVRAARALRP